MTENVTQAVSIRLFHCRKEANKTIHCHESKHICFALLLQIMKGMNLIKFNSMDLVHINVIFLPHNSCTEKVTVFQMAQECYKGPQNIMLMEVNTHL